MNEKELDIITDYLVQLYNRGNINLELKFDDRRKNSNAMNVAFPYHFTLCLINKLKKEYMSQEMKDDNNDDDAMTQNWSKIDGKMYLDENKFVVPFYGGNQRHFFNNLTMFDLRVSIEVHLYFDKRLEFILLLRSIESAKNASSTGICRKCDCVDRGDMFDVDELFGN